MIELNDREPIQIINVKGGFSFQLNIDASKFGAYQRQGTVENVKVPKVVSYHSLAQSYVNPVASSPDGMLQVPDLRFWGRSDQLHLAVRALHRSYANGRYPDYDQAD